MFMGFLGLTSDFAAVLKDFLWLRYRNIRLQRKCKSRCGALLKAAAAAGVFVRVIAGA
jgi:hypothetical protein